MILSANPVFIEGPCVLAVTVDGKLWVRRLDRPLDDPREWTEVSPPPVDRLKAQAGRAGQHHPGSK